MEYLVIKTQQIAVVADNPEEAQKKVLNGEGSIIGSTLGANPRPQRQSVIGQVDQLGQHVVHPAKS